MSKDDTVVITGVSRIQLVGLLQAKYRLKLEIESGVKFKQSTLQAVNRFAYTQFPEVGENFFKRKQPAYEWLCLVVDELKEQLEAAKVTS